MPRRLSLGYPIAAVGRLGTRKSNYQGSVMKLTVCQSKGRLSRGQYGLTLIELLIVVIIIGILAAVALPAYQDMVQKSRRTDARNALLSAQLAMEKYRGDNQSYASSVSALGIGATSPDGYYTLAVDTASTNATAFVMTATPVGGGPQASDSCGTFAVNQDGPNSSGSYASADCWK